jgi:hypothetical protein
VSDPDKPADAAPERVQDAGTGPVSSGRVIATPADIKSGPVRAAISAAVSGGVEALGASIGAVGEGVSKLGDLSKMVPLVGANIGKLGEAVTRAGETIHALPGVAKTRRGAILVRSVLVGFALVAMWIAAIVGIQIDSDETVDFRHDGEAILAQLSRGTDAIDQVYEHASPRFQEMVRKERFVDDMTDLAATVGTFREITAVNDTLVTSGPGGRVGRVSITAAYANGVCRGSISFHLDQGRWKLLGVGLELPPDLKITQKEREQRVAACKDNGNRKTCDVRDRAETVLEQLRDDKAGDVWDQASGVFQQQESRAQFVELQQEHGAMLGSYLRVLRVTEARTGIGGTSATFDCVVEFDRSSGVRVVFGFERKSKAQPWQLSSFKLVVPMPRVDDAAAATR